MECFLNSLPDSFNFKVPEVYQIEISSVCNLKCPSCLRNIPGYEVARKSFIDVGLVETIAKRDLSNSYFVELQLSGEPLLHPELEKIIKILKSKVKVGLSTNGTLIRGKLDALKHLDYLTVSVDSMNKEKYERVRKGSSFEEFTDNLILLKELKNVKIDYQVVDYLKEDNVDKTSAKSEMENLSSFLKRNNLTGVVRSVPDCFMTYHTPSIHSTCKELCLNPWLSISVQTNGNCVPCCFDFTGECVYGNLNDNSLEELWQSDVLEDMRQSHKSGELIFKMCHKCYMRSPALLHLGLMFNWVKDTDAIHI